MGAPKRGTRLMRPTLSKSLGNLDSAVAYFTTYRAFKSSAHASLASQVTLASIPSFQPRHIVQDHQ